MIAAQVSDGLPSSAWLIDMAAFTLLCVTAATVLAVTAGWRSHLYLQARQRQAQQQTQAGTLPDEPAAGRAFAAEMIDLATAICDVARCGEAEALCSYAHLTVAVQPGLCVRCDPRVMRDVLGSMLRDALRAAPAGCVLFAAMNHGGRVQVSVTHDGENGGGMSDSLREAGGLVALQGGTLEIPIAGTEGRSIVLRLPAPPEPGVGRATSVNSAAAHAPPAQTMRDATATTVAQAETIVSSQSVTS